MRISSIKTYEFVELDIKSRERAKECLIDVMNDEFYFSKRDIEKEISDMLENQGFSVDEFYYSGFGSQGDGASFEANHVKGLIRTNSCMYSHSDTMTFRPYIEYDNLSDEKRDNILYTAKYMADLYYEKLRKEHERIFIDVGFIMEYCDNYNILFLSDGTMINKEEII